MSQPDVQSVPKKRPCAQVALDAEKKSKSEQGVCVSFPYQEEPLMRLYKGVVASHASNSALVNVSDKADCQLLVMLTSSFAQSRERMSNGKTGVFKFVVCKILSAGYATSPYEPRDAPVKSKMYTDKDGKPKDSDSKPERMYALQNVQVGDAMTPVLTFKSHAVHPNPVLKTKARGKTTKVVGGLYEGLPLTLFVYEDNVEKVFGSEQSSAVLEKFSFAIIEVRVRNSEQCVRQWGVALKSVSGVSVPLSFNTFPSAFLYSAYKDIAGTTSRLLARKMVSEESDSDLFFVERCIRSSDSGEVTESPIVVVDLKGAESAKLRLLLSINPSNQGPLELCFDDVDSIYHGKRFNVVTLDGIFPSYTTHSWLCEYYGWFIRARLLKIIIIHDEYAFQRGNMLDCIFVVDHASLFAKVDAHLQVSSELVELFKTGCDSKHQKLDLNSDGKFSVWSPLGTANKFSDSDVAFCVFDVANRYRIGGQSGGVRSSHTSLLTEPNPLMHTEEPVWLMYLCVGNKSRVDSMLCCAVEAPISAVQGSASMLLVPAGVRQYTNALDFMQPV